MDQTPIVSLAGGHPLIDIDATVIVQLVLFLVLFVVANRLLFQPYLKLRERRRAGIEGARARAERPALRDVSADLIDRRALSPGSR